VRREENEKKKRGERGGSEFAQLGALLPEVHCTSFYRKTKIRGY
jgi:hypothetical protein